MWARRHGDEKCPELQKVEIPGVKTMGGDTVHRWTVGLEGYNDPVVGVLLQNVEGWNITDEARRVHGLGVWQVWQSMVVAGVEIAGLTELRCSEQKALSKRR